MKIKHFSGYGTVRVRKVGHSKLGDTESFTIQVVGNHEQGLLRNFYDPRVIHDWIGKRYAKDRTWIELDNYRVLKNGYVKDPDTGCDTEYAVYRLVYKDM